MEAHSTSLRTLLLERGLTLGALADRLGVHKSQTSRWSSHGVPAERVVEVERATGIPRQLLRPELYEGMGVQSEAAQ